MIKGRFKISYLIQVLVLTIGVLVSPTSKAAQVSVYFPQILSLLPDDVKIFPAEGDLAKQIDEVVLKILRTPTGKNFCTAVAKDSTMMRNAFFAGTSQISKAMNACQGSFGQTPSYHIWPKSYFIALTKDQKLKASGWTTPRNETILFFHYDEFTADNLLRAITHELAISFDAKEKIGYAGILDWTKVGIVRDQNSCDSQYILTETPIKQTFSAIRAIQMEMQVASEAGYAIPQGYRKWAAKSCEERFLTLYPAVQEFSQTFYAENLLSQLQATPIDCVPSHDYRQQSLQEKVSVLKSSLLHFQRAKTIDACIYMSQALPYKAAASFNGGPGPRIGGGGWAKLGKGD